MSTFRNRYLNAGYRGAADLGPVRFNNSNGAQALAQTAPAPALAATQGAPLATTQPMPTLQTAAASQYAAAPAPAAYRATARDSYANSGAEAYPADPVSAPPYYIPAPHAVPAVPFSGAFAQGSTGTQHYAQSRSADPAQSIPFGRLHAKQPTFKTYKFEKGEPIPTASEIEGRRPRTPPYKRPELTQEKIESKQHSCKESIARRLPEKERLRYHVPGYMGFVRTHQFRHGDTYGMTTRKCISDFPGGL